MSSHPLDRSPATAATANIRMDRPTFNVLKEHMTSDQTIEQFAFALFSTARTADGTVLIIRQLLIPSRADLRTQSAGAVSPTKEFQSMAYLLAGQSGMGILDIHTHVSRSAPAFSGIDRAESAKNAEYICRTFASPVTHAMLVFNRDVTSHDAVIFDRRANKYRQADWLQILGRHIEIRRTGEDESKYIVADEQFSRQLLIPGWKQRAIARQRIAILGAGGNGAHLIQSLVCMGAGTEGWIAAIDPDIAEESNRPRIPYACEDDIGVPKVTVAARYAASKQRRLCFYPYPCSATKDAAIDRIKAATVIFGAGDSDGLRKLANEMSVRYSIPLIDLGCDIQVNEGGTDAGGQVRVVTPGANACLVCCRGYDPAEAALDLMNDESAGLHAARGYVRGAREQATPSVGHLNATTAQLGIGAFLGLVHGPCFGSWDYAHFDQFTAETLVAKTTRRASCPLCGDGGFCGAGDADQAGTDTTPPKLTRVEVQHDAT